MFHLQPNPRIWVTVAAMLLGIASEAHAQDSAAEATWRERALAEFPELGVKDSPLNKRFVFMVTQLKEKAPQFFGDPTWPYKLAKSASAHEWPPEIKMPTHDPAFAKRLEQLCEAALKEGIRRQQITGDLKRFNEKDGSIKWSAWPELLELSEKYIPDTEEALNAFVRSIILNVGELKENEQYWVALTLARPEFQKWLEAGQAERLKLLVQLLPSLGDVGEVLSWIKGGKSHSYNGINVSYADVPKEFRFKALEFIVQQRLQLGELRFTKDQILEATLEAEHWEILFQISLDAWPATLWTDTRAPIQAAGTLKGEEWKEYFNNLDALHQVMAAPPDATPAKPAEPAKPEPNKVVIGGTTAPKVQFGPGRLEKCLMWRCLRFDTPNEAATWLNKVSMGVGTLPDKNAHEAKRIFSAMSVYFKGTWRNADPKAPAKPGSKPGK